MPVLQQNLFGFFFFQSVTKKQPTNKQKMSKDKNNQQWCHSRSSVPARLSRHAGTDHTLSVFWSNVNHTTKLHTHLHQTTLLHQEKVKNQTKKSPRITIPPQTAPTENSKSLTCVPHLSLRG